MKPDLIFVLKTSITYCVLAAIFSFLGIFLPGKAPLENPLTSFSLEEVGGHLIWGLVAGAASLSLRYFLLSGFFAVLIDSDHFIGLFHIDALSRMGHSLAFGIISLVVIMLLFGKRNYLLGAIVFGGMLTHLSYDTFVGGGEFPIFTPFYNKMIQFQNTDWFFFEIGAVVVIISVMTLTRKRALK